MERLAEDLLSGYETENSCRKGIFGIRTGKVFGLKGEYDEKVFAELSDKIRKKLGDPDFVHGELGYVWKMGNGFLTCGVTEISYGCDRTEVGIYKKLPLGKKVAFSDYAEITDRVKRIFAERGISVSGNLFYFWKGYFFFFRGQDKTYMLSIVRKRFVFAYSATERRSDGAETARPVFRREKRLRRCDADEIAGESENCLDSVKAVSGEKYEQPAK